jgi:hypothetical protein
MSPGAMLTRLFFFTHQDRLYREIQDVCGDEMVTDEGMTPRSSIFAYLVPAKEEARSKDTRSLQGPALRLGVEGKNYL